MGVALGAAANVWLFDTFREGGGPEVWTWNPHISEDPVLLSAAPLVVGLVATLARSSDRGRAAALGYVAGALFGAALLDFGGHPLGPSLFALSACCIAPRGLHGRDAAAYFAIGVVGGALYVGGVVIALLANAF